MTSESACTISVSILGWCERAECSNAPRRSHATEEFNFLYSPEVGDEVEVLEDEEQSQIGRKRKCNPENWKKKHVKQPALRKNLPLIVISNEMECCKKKYLQTFSSAHLDKVRKDVQELFYEQQNIYLNGLLHRRQTRKTTGHPRKPNPVTTSGGKRVG